MVSEDATEVTVDLLGGMAFRGLAGDHTIQLDAGPTAGGDNAGASPMDLLLIALAGCMAMDVLSILRKKRQSVQGYTVRACGQRAQEHPRVFTDITLHHHVTGVAVQPEAVARAIELSMTRYCPVNAMLSKAVAISSTYSVAEAE